MQYLKQPLLDNNTIVCVIHSDRLKVSGVFCSYKRRHLHLPDIVSQHSLRTLELRTSHLHYDECYSHVSMWWSWHTNRHRVYKPQWTLYLRRAGGIGKTKKIQKRRFVFERQLPLYCYISVTVSIRYITMYFCMNSRGTANVLTRAGSGLFTASRLFPSFRAGQMEDSLLAIKYP